MTLKDDLIKEVKDIFISRWTERSGTVVPDDSSVTLGNDAVKLDATVLYADLSGSTKMVDSYPNWFSAEVYKSYLRLTARIIRSEAGTITSYDGDRIMSVFIGDKKNTSAVRAALKINWGVKNVINTSIQENSTEDFTIKHVVGIDTSSLFVAKSGIRNANDLVWVGRAANYAAKLSDLGNYPTYITGAVYDKMLDAARYASGVNMWEERTWTNMDNMRIYGSTYWWPL